MKDKIMDILNKFNVPITNNVDGIRSSDFNVMTGSISKLLTSNNQQKEGDEINFILFKERMNWLMVLENIESKERLEELMHDWYILYKETGYTLVQDWVDFQFPKDEVNESTHDFWRKMR